MKRCLGCGEEKVLDAFSPHARGKQGRAPRCKECLRPVHRAAARSWRARNLEKARANSRKWRAENLERARAQARAWAKANPEKRNANARAHHLGRGDTGDYGEILRRDPCCYCGAASGHVDHIEPVARGGPTAWENLTAACPSCNGSKQKAPMLTFLLERVA